MYTKFERLLKAIKVIESCNETWQLDVAKRYAAGLLKMDFPYDSLLNTLCKDLGEYYSTKSILETTIAAQEIKIQRGHVKDA
jgi:hypothetical protein